MSGLAAGGFALFTAGIVGLMLWVLVARLRVERDAQPPATRSPIGAVVLVGFAPAAILGAVVMWAGWEPVSVFRLAMIGVVVLASVSPTT